MMEAEAVAVAEGLQCIRNDGKGWRCKKARRDSAQFCEHHYQAWLCKGAGGRRTGRSKQFTPSLRDWSDDLQAPDKGSANHPEAKSAIILPQDVKQEGIDIDGLISTDTSCETTFMSTATNQCEIGAKRIPETPKCASSMVRLKEENKQLKAEVEELKKQCTELKTTTTSDAYEKVVLSRLLEQSRDEIKKLEGKVASLVDREDIINTLCNSILLGGQSEDADVKRARQSGYNDGFRDGKRMGWREFVELQKREPS